MNKLIVNYNFNALEIDNLAGADGVKFKNSSLITGPGNTSIGNYPKAINLKNSGKASVNLTKVNPNTNQFCIEVAFKVNASVVNRQNIVESNFLPFALYASKGRSQNSFVLVSSVNVFKHGWSKVDTQFEKTLKIGHWYTVSIVYDFDTLGIFIDGRLVSVHGFPHGLIKKNTSKKLFFGTWVDGARNHFNGALAGFKWSNGIPTKLESLLDEQRSSAQWHISYKYMQIKTRINTGKKEQGIKYDSATGSHTQFYQRCAIMYHESVGVAFEMHGAIYSKYKSMRNKSDLGYLVTDESRATIRSGRKSLFSKGGIYWSSASKAIPVLDQIYLEYENLGESKALGFPTRTARAVPSGKEQIFQKARMYYKNGAASAKEVHGAILTKYLQLGGVRKWGFPITNESDIRHGQTVKGKFSEFENCTIYWKAGIGAFEVHGDIRRKYQTIKGPLGSLGFPTSNEVNIPHYSGTGKINSFEKGSILWFGNYNSIKVARPFKIRLQRIHSRESEGCCMGQNDLHFYIKIKDGSRTLYNKRFPKNGDYGGHNVINPNKTFPVEIIPNNIHQRISFDVDIRDSDPGDDDHLGTKTTVLSAANAWGYRQSNLVFNQSFSKIKTFLWSIRPKINIASLSEKEKWWGFSNFSTPVISKDQYAATFRDVDSETEWWDIPDGLKTLYYKGVVKGIASGGNCFGMSLEAIYARKNNSLLNQPLVDIVKVNNSINEINIKHAYQVGARPIWWFLGQFVTGSTHSPKHVFLKTRSAFRRGNNPVVCIAQNYNFSGKPHCIMPYAWDTSRKPWKMKVMDPNFPKNGTKVITINPDENTFRYVGGGTYSGSRWDGGRFHYMPFSILDTPQRTPIWDAILLLLSGTIIILADDAQTVNIKDANGNDLDGNGERAKQKLKSGAKLEEFFTSFVGYETGDTIKPGQILLRREKFVSSDINSEAINFTSLPLATLVTNRRLRGFTARTLPSNLNLKNSISGRSAHYILNDPTVANNLSTTVKNNLNQVRKINNYRNFKHKVKGSKNGKLEYFIQSGLNEIKINSTIGRNELNTIEINDLNTNVCKINFTSPKTKSMNLQITNKLGVNGEYITMDIEDIPVQANKAVSVNIRQGLSGLEIVNHGAPINLPVKFSGKIEGKNITNNFTIPFEGTIRIKPSTMINTNNLVVSNITQLFGTIKKTQIIRKN